MSGVERGKVAKIALYRTRVIIEHINMAHDGLIGQADYFIWLKLYLAETA